MEKVEGYPSRSCIWAVFFFKRLLHHKMSYRILYTFRIRIEFLVLFSMYAIQSCTPPTDTLNFSSNFSFLLFYHEERIETFDRNIFISSRKILIFSNNGDTLALYGLFNRGRAETLKRTPLLREHTWYKYTTFYLLIRRRRMNGKDCIYLDILAVRSSFTREPKLPADFTSVLNGV